MECALCGMPLTGGTAVWPNTSSRDRDPYCSEDCMWLDWFDSL